MVQSNALSQWANLCPNDDTDSNDRTLLPPDLFVNLIKDNKKIDNNNKQIMLPDELFIHAINIALQDKILAGQKWDRVVVDALDALKHSGTLPMKSTLTDWRTDGSLIFYKGRCYVPNNMELWWNIVRQHYDLPPWDTWAISKLWN